MKFKYNYNLIKHSNVNFLHKILCIKLSEDIIKRRKETYYIIEKNKVLYGIKRISYDNKGIKYIDFWIDKELPEEYIKQFRFFK